MLNQAQPSLHETPKERTVSGFYTPCENSRWPTGVHIHTADLRENNYALHSTAGARHKVPLVAYEVSVSLPNVAVVFSTCGPDPKLLAWKGGYVEGLGLFFHLFRTENRPEFQVSQPARWPEFSEHTCTISENHIQSHRNASRKTDFGQTLATAVSSALSTLFSSHGHDQVIDLTSDQVCTNSRLPLAQREHPADTFPGYNQVSDACIFNTHIHVCSPPSRSHEPRSTTISYRPIGCTTTALGNEDGTLSSARRGIPCAPCSLLAFSPYSHPLSCRILNLPHFSGLGSRASHSRLSSQRGPANYKHTGGGYKPILGPCRK